MNFSTMDPKPNKSPKNRYDEKNISSEMVAMIVKKHVLPMFKSKSTIKSDTGINSNKTSVFGELNHIDKLGDQLHDI